MNFIICDDEKIFLEELSNKIIECLEKQNIDMNIKVCNSGKKLLNICKTLSVDAIFLDIDIPEMNGFQIAKNVRKLYPDCMIIFCSVIMSWYMNRLNMNLFGSFVSQIMKENWIQF